MKIQVYGYSDIGGRPENEDSYNITNTKSCGSIILADGLGGHGKGRAASNIVVESLSKLAGDELPDENKIIEALKEADSRIISERENTFQMKTTAVCLYFNGKRAIWAHSGDSRLYHFYNRELADFTLDHSVSQLAVALGEIERKDIPWHPERNKVLRVIGGEEINPDFKTVELEKGFHAFLVCSDGFWEYLSDEEIRLDLYKIKTPEEWIISLRKRMFNRLKEKNDNNTAAAAFINI